MTNGNYSKDWYVFRHADTNMQDVARLPAPPPWRDFQDPQRRTYYQFELEDDEIAVVNAALYLRRPLLVTGPPGAGKSSLAYTIATELGLADVLKWPITSRATVKDALYRYDAIGRLQTQRQRDYERHAGDGNANGDANREPVPIGQFLQLGPLGTAFADSEGLPRVLLIDEIDKSDIDLPNDLLNLFEEGTFEITELARLHIDAETEQEIGAEGENDSAVDTIVNVRKHDSRKTVAIRRGVVTCVQFPVIIITSNGERELPAPFLRRCLRIDIAPPTVEKLERIVAAHFLGPIQEKSDGEQAELRAYIRALAEEMEARRNKDNEFIATDQLLNAIYLRLHDADGLSLASLAEAVKKPRDAEERKVVEFVLRAISRMSQLSNE